ncbi:helicase associated domain-containing protein [Nocardioides sp. SYSU DS0651]|uniref:helicase associated domain-containing protein n=1 Tax=Nocardioides sp. SYSU DS0651 TaxID=3415955 RepID=UPI003F4BD992
MVDEKRASWRGATWETGLDFLRQYVEANGSAEISVDCETPEGFRLGRWVNTQRVWRRSGRLTPEREVLLDELGLVWEPMSHAQRKRVQRDTDMLAWLASFVAANGHADAPSELTLADGTNVGAWVRLVRREFVTGSIRPDLETSLRELGFEFTPNRAKFARGLTALRDYVATHGSIHVPSSHVTADGFELGAWFANVKMKLRRDGLPDEYAEALRELGIDGAHDPREESWRRNLDAFRTWVARQGHPRVPKDLQMEDGTRLGQWLGVQRNWLAQARLKEERKQLLDSVHPDWAATRVERWDRDSAIEAIGEAATMAFPLTVSAYLDLRASGLDVPPLSRIQRLFGSWMDACVAAGVQSGPSTVSWQTEKHSDVEVLRLLRIYLETAGEWAGPDSYDSWAEEFDAPPRSVLLRRFATWDQAVGKALSLADEVIDRD